jgi:hypothetical protein
VTADHLPLPGESSGRHRPSRLFPLGVEVRHAIARAGYRWAAIPHTHGSDT